MSVSDGYEIVMVPVIDIIRNVTGSCDFQFMSFSNPEDKGKPEFLDNTRTNFWMHVIDYKSSDSGFIRLVNSILENGWDEESSIGWDGSFISEGHHRLVAAILMGMEYVACSKWSTPSYAHEVSAHHEYSYENKHPFLV